MFDCSTSIKIICHRLVITATVLVLCLGGHVLQAQTAGDEDKEMFNRAKARDQQAIDEAKNGWWTASMKNHAARIAWWREAKFGMFIHWGIYSLPAGEWNGKKVSGYAEHLMRKEKISRRDYLDLAHRFNPVRFNAEEWVLHAQKAGMKYFIITAKHHDGFAMYDSKTSDFTLLKQSPFKRDPMAELAAACKKHGMKFGFYYSHAFDWEHPDAPGNDWEYNNPGGDKLLHGGANWFDVHPELLPKAQAYVTQKAIPQIKELLINYHPDILWFDTPHKLPLSENIRILQAIRATDPDVVVNGRLVRSAAGNFGDYQNTADRPAEFFPVTGDWEAIPTTNESYGYHQFDNSHKPAGFFIQLMAKAAAKGGNLLMNIGPKGDGTFDTKDLTILNGIGDWLHKNGESIYNTQPSRLPLQNWGVVTSRANKIFLHVFHWPADGILQVGGLTGKGLKAYFLADKTKKPLETLSVVPDLFIKVGSKATDTTDAVIVVESEGPVKTDRTPFVAGNIPVSRFLAFDATLHGNGLKFGDGKTNRYFVEGWKSKDQWCSWDFRTTAANTYKIVIRYIAPAGGDTSRNESIYQCSLGSFSVTKKVTTPTGKIDVITEALGTVTLKPGVHQLSINPVSINGELMKLLDIQLIQQK